MISMKLFITVSFAVTKCIFLTKLKLNVLSLQTIHFTMGSLQKNKNSPINILSVQ